MKLAKVLGVLCAISIGLKTCYGEFTDENNSNSENCEHEKQGLREADQDIKIANLVNTVMTQNVKIANLESTIIAQNAKINVKVANLESAITAQNAKFSNPESTIMAQNVKVANLESTITAQNAKINVKVANLESAITAQNAKINVKFANLESTVLAQIAKITNPESSIAAQNIKIANLETVIMAQKAEFGKLVNQVLERRISQITSDYRFHERLQQEIEHRKYLNDSQNALAENMKALKANHSTGIDELKGTQSALREKLEMCFEKQSLLESDIQKIVNETNHIMSIDELKGTQSALREKMEMCFEKQLLLESDLQKIVNETAELGLQVEINNIQIRRNTNFTRSSKIKDCQDVQSKGNSVSGVYGICFQESSCISVYCDMDTDGGGWTVFQHRYDGSVDFYRTWADYKTGFGNLHGEFWLGNENIHKLSFQNNYKLRINLEDTAGTKRYAEYSSFVLGNDLQKYRLHIGSYSGNAGDSLKYHNDRPFSTRDRDSDSLGSASCAVSGSGAWWYGNCYQSNLNGLYSKSKTDTIQNNIWYNWSGGHTNMKSSTMMIRRI